MHIEKLGLVATLIILLIGSAVYVGMALLFVCCNTNKSRTTPEQDQKLTNEAYHEEAGTEQCT